MSTTYSTIESKLIETFSPDYLEILDESHMHGGGQLRETHFKVTIVCASFADKRLLQRHRLVNSTLSAELNGGVHALALHTYTPTEWNSKAGVSPDSPNCRGGSKIG